MKKEKYDLAGLIHITTVRFMCMVIAEKSKSTGSSLRTGDHEIGLSHTANLIWNPDCHCDLVESHRDQFHKIHREEHKKT